MKRVTFITEYSGLGGGETSLFNLMVNFKQYCDITLVTLEDGNLNKIIRKEGIEEQSISYKQMIKKVKLIKLYKSLHRLLKETDVVVLNSKSNLFLIPFIKRVKRIPIFYIEHSNWTKYSFIEKILLKKVQNVLTVSEAVKHNLTKQVHLNEVVDFPLGIPLDGIQEEKGMHLKKRPVIAMIGRFQRIKGHDFFIEVVKSLGNLGNKYDFYIIGGKPFATKEEDEYEEEILSLINKYGLKKQVKLLGERRDVDKLLKEEIDILIVPSINESFGMVVLEAAKYGVPIITSENCEGPTEILRKLNLENLVVTRESKAFAEKITYILSDDVIYKKHSDLLINNVERFNVTNNVNTLLSLMKK